MIRIDIYAFCKVTGPRYWPFVRGIHRSPVNSPHKGQWRGTLMFCLISARINCWVNNRFNSILRSTTQEKRYVNVRVLIHTKLLKYTSFVLGILLYFQLCLTICHFVAWLWNYGYLLVTCSTVIFIHLFIHSFRLTSLLFGIEKCSLRTIWDSSCLITLK